MNALHPDSTGRAVVDASTPRGCKLQLINRSAGVARLAPLPVFE